MRLIWKQLCRSSFVKLVEFAVCWPSVRLFAEENNSIIQRAAFSLLLEFDHIATSRMKQLRSAYRAPSNSHHLAHQTARHCLHKHTHPKNATHLLFCFIKGNDADNEYKWATRTRILPFEVNPLIFSFSSTVHLRLCCRGSIYFWHANNRFFPVWR